MSEQLNTEQSDKMPIRHIWRLFYCRHGVVWAVEPGIYVWWGSWESFLDVITWVRNGGQRPGRGAGEF